MQNVRLIACLDVDAGRVVKGIRFADLRDIGDPVDLARRYQEAGIDELVFYDITASAQQRDIIIDVVARTAEEVFIPLTVGGGVSSVEHADRILRAGADKVSVNTAAVEDPGLITELSEIFGAQCVVVSIDAKRNGSGFEIYTHGGRRASGRDAVRWARECERRGAGELVLNSIDADGTQDGYDLGLLGAIAAAVNIPIVASGGVGTFEHLVDGVGAGADAVLAASVFHLGTAGVAEAKRHLLASGVSVRPA